MLTPSVALALLIGAGSLTLPPWGNAADQRVAQATSLKDAGLDATKVEELDLNVEILSHHGKFAEAIAIAERILTPGFRKDVTPLIHPSGGLRT
jgi:hypothetical protein